MYLMVERSRTTQIEQKINSCKSALSEKFANKLLCIWAFKVLPLILCDILQHLQSDLSKIKWNVTFLFVCLFTSTAYIIFLLPAKVLNLMESSQIELKMTDNNCTIKQSIGFQTQFNCKIKERLTKFVVHRFTNKCMILITQYDGLPNSYLVQFDAKDELEKRIAPMNISELHTSVPVTMKCVLGVDKPEVRAGIQFLINRTKLSKCPTEILITLGLRETNGDILKEIAEILDKNL